MATTVWSQGLTLRAAAIIAGLGYLLSPAAFAEFGLYQKLVVSGNAEQTVANLNGHHGQLALMFLLFFINFTGDIVIAWALFYLLAPVNRAVSALAALFQLVYATIALVGTLNLATAYNMLTHSEYVRSFGPGPLHAQVNLLIHMFRIDYALGLILFGVHLMLIGVLIVRASYMPSWLGILLIADGFAWIVTELRPYFYPGVDLSILSYIFWVELVFMLWLLVMGWKLKSPAAPSFSGTT